MTDTTGLPGPGRPGLLEQDNYGVAVAAAAKELRSRELVRLAAIDGVHTTTEGALRLVFLGAPVMVGTDDWSVTSAAGEPLPTWEQILVLHYLLGTEPKPLPNDDRWLAYRELPEASFFAASFARQVCQPLAARFGETPDELKSLVGRFGATPGDTGDASLRLTPLPGLALQLVVWAGDDDFPAEGNVLFNPAIAACMTAEDAAVLADVALRRLLDLP